MAQRSRRRILIAGALPLLGIAGASASVPKQDLAALDGPNAGLGPAIGLIGFGGFGSWAVRRLVREVTDLALPFNWLTVDFPDHSRPNFFKRHGHKSASTITRLIVVHALGGSTGGDHALDVLERFLETEDEDSSFPLTIPVHSIALMPFSFEAERYRMAEIQYQRRDKIPRLKRSHASNDVPLGISVARQAAIAEFYLLMLAESCLRGPMPIKIYTSTSSEYQRLFDNEGRCLPDPADHNT